MPRLPRRSDLTERARELRRLMTPEERRLWWFLRGLEVKFRRQEPLDSYIVDFVSYRHRLVVEVDGSHHGGPYDETRDARLGDLGFRVLRFTNTQVNQEIDTVIETITQYLYPAD